jgi:beta-phosphoglucomutase
VDDVDGRWAAAIVISARTAAVAFDLDGTLVDLERYHHGAFLHAAGEAGVRLTWDQAFDRLPHFVGGPDVQVAAEIAELSSAGVSPMTVFESKRRHYSALIAADRRITARTGVTEVVELVLRRGIAVAVGTVTERDIALDILHRAGLLPLIGESRVVTADDVTQLKPAPDVYLETARRMEVSPMDQLVFEDSVTGVSAACSAMSSVIAVPTVDDISYLRSLTSAGAMAIFRDWSDPGLVALLDRLLPH